MLSVASVGMAAYGVYSIGWAVIDLIRGPRLEWWADIGMSLFGALLVLSGAFVRVRLPGGLAFAIGAMLALQGLAVHNAVHLDAGLAPQIGRGILAAALVLLAAAGERRSNRKLN